MLHPMETPGSSGFQVQPTRATAAPTRCEMGIEHTLPAHQLLENFYNGFPSCLIGYLNLRNKLFDSLLAVPKDDW